jgi:pyruvate/2-oxoacid:ferredoxin oxidoreductase alpha subunit
MIKTSLIVAGCLSFATAFTQTTTNHIEIVVSESVELKPKEADIRIFVESSESQRNNKAYSYGYGESYYDYEGYGYSEEDYEYEYMMSENPKKVTKKMKQEYEARQKQREEDMEAMEREHREQERQNELELANFDPFDLADMMALLKENNISFTIVDRNSESSGSFSKHLDYLMNSDYEMERGYSDTVLSIKVSDSKAYQDLMNLISDLPASSVVNDVEYETNETINKVVIPKLTEKATNQARALADSFGRKLGKVIQCSNIYPYTPSSNYMRSYMDDIVNDDHYDGDPFLSTKKEVLEYVYRFELLN